MNNVDDSLFNAIIGGSIAILIFLLLLVIAFSVVYIIGYWKLFKKAGYDGWKSIVPFYNTFVLIQIAGLNWWYFLIACAGTIFSILGLSSSILSLLVSIATMYIHFIIFWNIAKKTHKSTTSTAVLGTFFYSIMIMIVGYSKNYTFDNTVTVSPNGPFESNQNNNNNNNNNYTNNNNYNNYNNENTNNNYTTSNNVNTTNNNVNTNTTSNNTERYCVSCGAKLIPNSNFCDNCGKKVD